MNILDGNKLKQAKVATLSILSFNACCWKSYHSQVRSSSAL